MSNNSNENYPQNNQNLGYQNNHVGQQMPSGEPINYGNFQQENFENILKNDQNYGNFQNFNEQNFYNQGQENANYYNQYQQYYQQQVQQNPQDQNYYYQQQYQQFNPQYNQQYQQYNQNQGTNNPIKKYMPYIVIAIILVVSLAAGAVYFYKEKQAQAEEEAKIMAELEGKANSGDVYDENGNLIVNQSDGNSPSSRPIDADTNLSGSIVDKINSIEEKEKSVVSLPQSFFGNWNPDMMKIKETSYRNLNINPEFESDKKFFTYNNQGIMKPYNPEVYYNREIFGLSITTDYLINNVKYDYELNLQRENREQPPIKLGITFDKSSLRDKIKTNLDILRSSGFYPDLKVFTDDEIIQKIFNIIEPYNLSREDAIKYYTQEYLEQPDVYFARNNNLNEMDKEMYKFKYKKVPEVIKLIRVSPAKTLTKVQYGQILFDCIKKRVELELNSIKKEACNELQSYKEGTCKNYKDISTLEIRSDFIQDIYAKSFTKAIEDFYFVIYYAYDGLSNT